jgi:hypothetical protein
MGNCIRAEDNHTHRHSELLSSSPVNNSFGFNIILISKSHLYFLLRKEIYNVLKGKSNR